MCVPRCQTWPLNLPVVSSISYHEVDPHYKLKYIDVNAVEIEKEAFRKWRISTIKQKGMKKYMFKAFNSEHYKQNTVCL